MDELAEHIYRSEGPSGLNRDYLWGLEESLKGLGEGSEDEHVSDLSERVRRIARREEEKGTAQEEEHEEVGHPFRKVSSIDEVEEMEKGV